MSEKSRRTLASIETLRDAERQLLAEFYKQIAGDMMVSLGEVEERFVGYVAAHTTTLGAQMTSVVDAITQFGNDYRGWREDQVNWRNAADQRQRDMVQLINTVQAEVRQTQEVIREVHAAVQDLTARLDNAEQALADVVVEREAPGDTE